MSATVAYLAGGSMLAAPLAVVAIVQARRALVERLDARRNPQPPPTWNDHTPLPVYDPVPEVLTGQIVAVDELGEWEPDAYPLAQALIADDVMSCLPWETLRSREVVMS